MTLSCKPVLAHMKPSSLCHRHLYDVQPATFAGLSNEFIFSPRLDNQLSSYVIVPMEHEIATQHFVGLQPLMLWQAMSHHRPLPRWKAT